MNFSDKTDIEKLIAKTTLRNMYQWHRDRITRIGDDSHRIPYNHYRKVMRKLFIEKLFIGK